MNRENRKETHTNTPHITTQNEANETATEDRNSDREKKRIESNKVINMQYTEQYKQIEILLT